MQAIGNWIVQRVLTFFEKTVLAGPLLVQTHMFVCSISFSNLLSFGFFPCLHSGRLLTALICEYLDWAQLGHTMKVYFPECNLVIIFFILH